VDELRLALFGHALTFDLLFSPIPRSRHAYWQSGPMPMSCLPHSHSVLSYRGQGQAGMARSERLAAVAGEKGKVSVSVSPLLYFFLSHVLTLSQT
jgi:hypothetical protein